MIVSLDDLPFREPIDLQFHYGQTRMTFVNVRTGQPQSAVIELGPRHLVDDYAAGLGICYILYRHGGNFGARLTRYPVAGTACAGLQLKPGDMIVSLDGQPIRGHADVRNHVGGTTLEFIDVRTGQTRSATVTLPSTVAPTAPAPPE